MNDGGTVPYGARFFDKTKQDLGRAAYVSAHLRDGSALTFIDVTGADAELTRALTLLDRSRLRIHCEDEGRTCYVFRWASGYGNGANVRIQGMLEPRTGRELEGWTAKVLPATTSPGVANEPSDWNPTRPRRAW